MDIKTLFEDGKERKITDVAKALQIERHTAAKHLKALKEKGVLEMRTKGRSKLYKKTNTKLFDFLQDKEGVSQEIQQLLKSLPFHISIQDQNYNIIWSSKDKTGKCYKAYANRNTKCPNCPAEQTLQNGKPHETRVKPLQKTVKIQPVKDKKQQTI